MFDIGFENGTLWLGGGWLRAQLYVQNGHIAAVSEQKQPCTHTVDAAGLCVLPGFLDPHVHFSLRVGENVSSDDFYTGSVQAALGGVTTFIDFIDPVRGVSEMQAAFAARRAQAAESALDYGLHACVRGIDEAADIFLRAAVSLGMPTVKLFTTYSSSGRRTDDADIYALLCASRAAHARIVVHAENDSLLREAPDIPVALHEKARPALCERTAVLNLCEMARAAEGLLYIVHTSAGSTAQRVREQYPELQHGAVLLESCPQYFWLDAALYKQPDGWRYTCTPPLREAAEQALLRAEFADIDTVGTDHCPFEPACKRRPFTAEIPMGIGGIRYAFPAMYTLFGESAIPKFTENTAKAEGLFPHKGTLLPGADADITLFDPHAPFIVADEASVYHGKTFAGQITQVFAHGTPVVQNGQFLGTRGAGRYLERSLTQI